MILIGPRITDCSNAFPPSCTGKQHQNEPNEIGRRSDCELADCDIARAHGSERQRHDMAFLAGMELAASPLEN